MRIYVVIHIVVWMLLSTLSFLGKAKEVNSLDIFVYSQSDQNESWVVGWHSVPEQELAGQVHVPSAPAAFAAPAMGHYFSLVDSESSNVYIVDALDTSLVKLDVPALYKEAFAYEHEYILARSMRWSPDGTTLAFVGQTTANRADIYSYDTISGKLVNLTADIRFTSDLLNLSAWSPDGRWLAFTGQWQQNSREITWTTGGIISSDGERFVALDPKEPVCKLIWSPTQEYVLSPTDCLSRPGSQDGTDLVIFADILAETSAPVPTSWHISSDTKNTWRYYYPTWNNDLTITAVRSLVQLVINGTPAPKFELVRYDVKNRQVQVIPVDTQLQLVTTGIQFGNKVVWKGKSGDEAIHSIDLPTGTITYIPVDYPDICSVFHARLSPNETYLAFVAGCGQDTLSSEVVIWDIRESSIFLKIGSPGLIASSLGWLSVSKSTS